MTETNDVENDLSNQNARAQAHTHKSHESHEMSQWMWKLLQAAKKLWRFGGGGALKWESVLTTYSNINAVVEGEDSSTKSKTKSKSDLSEEIEIDNR